MRYSNLHTHTIFSDGTYMPEEMILSAIENNMLSLGFSDHSPMENTIFYYMRYTAVPAYCREIRRLAEKYNRQGKKIAIIREDEFLGMLWQTS